MCICPILIYGETQSLSHGAVEVPLPLGENLQTFVVANADEVSGADKLSTTVIRQKDNMQKPVYISWDNGIYFGQFCKITRY